MHVLVGSGNYIQYLFHGLNPVERVAQEVKLHHGYPPEYVNSVRLL